MLPPAKRKRQKNIIYDEENGVSIGNVAAIFFSFCKNVVFDYSKNITTCRKSDGSSPLIFLRLKELSSNLRRIDNNFRNFVLVIFESHVGLFKSSQSVQNSSYQV